MTPVTASPVRKPAAFPVVSLPSISLSPLPARFSSAFPISVIPNRNSDSPPIKVKRLKISILCVFTASPFRDAVPFPCFPHHAGSLFHTGFLSPRDVSPPIRVQGLPTGRTDSPYFYVICRRAPDCGMNRRFPDRFGQAVFVSLPFRSCTGFSASRHCPQPFLSGKGAGRASRYEARPDSTRRFPPHAAFILPAVS